MKLYTAVVKEIHETKKFSAYNITRNLRTKVNSGLLVVDDVEVITLDNGEVVAEIEHEDVNDTIKDIFDNKVMSLGRTQGPGYFIYELDALPRVIIPRNIKHATPAKSPVGKVKVLNGFTKSERHQIYTKVASYVSTKRKSKEKITLKGIASALKIGGITVKDISDVCSNKLKYKVVKKTPNSLSEVK